MPTVLVTKTSNYSGLFGVLAVIVPYGRLEGKSKSRRNWLRRLCRFHAELAEEVVHAIRDVLAGHIYVSDEIMAGEANGSQPQGSERKNGPLGQLTDMELEVLELLGEGKTNREIARQLHLATRTVGVRCAQIERKLNLKSSNALIRYAVCWVEGGKT